MTEFKKYEPKKQLIARIKFTNDWNTKQYRLVAIGENYIHVLDKDDDTISYIYPLHTIEEVTLLEVEDNEETA